MDGRKLTKLAALGIVAVMLVPATYGCGGKDAGKTLSNAATSQTSSQATVNDPYAGVDWTHKGQTPEQILAGDVIRPAPNIKWPISERQITLKIMKPQVLQDSEYKDMAIFKDYEKKTNVHLEWNCPPSANFKDQFNLVVNSGADMPDIIIAPQPEEVERLGQQGIFMAWNDYLQYMPNLEAAFEKYPYARKAVYSDDGKMYSLPFIYQFVSGNNVMMIRQDWLDALKLQMPTTTDEWYNVLKAFKTQDPNGNKENDEWPFSGYGPNGTGMNLGARSLIAAWGVTDQGDGFYAAEKLYPKDNKIHYGPTEDRYREGLEWVAKLYSEKLIDPEILTNDDKAFQAKALSNTIGAWRGWINGDMKVLNDSALEADKNTKFAVREAPIMKGPYGDQIHPYADNNVLTNGMVMTKSNKYPKETAIWADYWYSEYGQTYVQGIEGLTYTIDSNGQPQWTDWVKNNPDGKTMNEVRGMVTFGRSAWPTVFSPWSLTASLFDPYIEEGRAKYRDPKLQVLALPTGMSFTLDENSRKKQLLNDIDTYVNETLTNFIIGKTPLNDATWAAYTQKLKDLGIDEVQKIYQASYDRFLKR